MVKNILLTGVSKGLGLEIAGLLLNKGYGVFGISRSVTPELSALKNKYADQLHLKQFDLSLSDKIKEEIFTDFIDLDTALHGFVNNAAIAYDDIVTNLQLEPLEKMYRVNVFSPMLIVKNVIRNFLLHQTSGSIVHLSSISVHTGYKGLAMYASTKGALEAFSRNTAREWGERKIRSNCIVAGFMPTDMNAYLSEEQLGRIARRTAMKELTDKASVVNMVEFLLSDRARSITGNNFFVDSGTI